MPKHVRTPLLGAALGLALAFAFGLGVTQLNATITTPVAATHNCDIPAACPTTSAAATAIDMAAGPKCPHGTAAATKAAGSTCPAKGTASSQTSDKAAGGTCPFSGAHI